MRAIFKNIEAGRTVEGASTITQQLVRNLYIQHPEQTIKRKLIEAHLAADMEKAHSKEWILTEYLNTAPYGTVEGQTAVGAEAAAQTYFAKPAKDLNLTEAALIAGLPQAPSEYNPFLDPRAATQRRNDVLEAMEEEGYITSDEYREAVDSGLGLQPGNKYRVIRDPFLFDLVQQELIDKYGINTVRNGGLKAYTTIDPELQERAQEAVEACGVCYPEGGPAAGLASVDPETGEIVALASTEGYATEDQFNYAWQAHRQPGSSFKPFVLAEAIKQGIDPDSTYYDGSSPMTLEIPGGGPPWEVNNSEGAGGGVVALDDATVHSVNVVFAQLDLDVGPENVTRMARELGIDATLDSVPAEGIGGLYEGVTPLEMASAYATFAAGGIHHEPTAISRVEFPDGEVDEPDAEDGERVLTEGQAYEVTRILEGVITEGTGAGYTYMGCSAAAGKTGTSEDSSDAWFAGYTPLYSTAVWVGHPQSRSYTGYGGPTAGPIWASFMSSATAGDCPEFEVAREPARARRAGERPHPLLLGSLVELRGPVEEEFEESGEKDEDEEGEGGDEGGEDAARPPTPRPRLPRRPRRPRRLRLPRKASAAASPRPTGRNRSRLVGPVGSARLDCLRWSPETLAALVVALGSLLATGSMAAAAPVIDGHFPTSETGTNKKIVAGPDGNMWLTVNGGGKDVARISPSGQVDEFELEGVAAPTGIGVDPEGRHLGHPGRRGRIVPSLGPERDQQSDADPRRQRPRLDRRRARTARCGSRRRKTSSTSPRPTRPARNRSPSPACAPKDIDVAGSLLVIADSNNKRIVTMTTAGVAQDHSLLDDNRDLPGGRRQPDRPDRLFEGRQRRGARASSPHPARATAVRMEGDPFGVALGSDGAYWFAMSAANNVQRLTPDGVATPLNGMPVFPGSPEFFPRQIAAGPNNTLWVTMEVPGENVYEVARVSGLEPPVKPGGDGKPPATAPETTIDKGPKKKVTIKGKAKRAWAKFRFSSTTRARPSSAP